VRGQPAGLLLDQPGRRRCPEWVGGVGVGDQFTVRRGPPCGLFPLGPGDRIVGHPPERLHRPLRRLGGDRGAQLAATLVGRRRVIG
jgi:hypothetical protein